VEPELSPQTQKRKKGKSGLDLSFLARKYGQKLIFPTRHEFGLQCSVAQPQLQNSIPEPKSEKGRKEL
jgi:hypothetical protein